MQAPVSDKTFHLKWNNHLQNLSQLFTTIYSSSALADVTLSCRDGTLKAHKLVLSACSPYFEQIFKDNPCQHPIVILKGIPFSEINLLVEFMYKGSVDVQELDLQSLMHTASELEIRGLAYEARDNAAQMLNVNLEYPAYAAPVVPTPQPYVQPPRTDVERLKQIHLYQQQMMRAEEMRRRRREEPASHSAVNNILAAAAREMEEARVRGLAAATTVTAHNDQDMLTGELKRENDEDRPKKRMSILTSEDDKLKAKKKPAMTVRFQDDVKSDDRPNKSHSPGAANETMKSDSKNELEGKRAGIKVVQLASLQKTAINDHDDSDDKKAMDDDETTDSSGSVSDTAVNEQVDSRPHVCDLCDLRFQRASHLSRHRLTHTGERPFTCGGCGRSFARSDKLRVHTKICERDDPTVDMATEPTTIKRESNSEVMSGMVRTSHRESGHLVFTASGDVMLPPRTAPIILNSTLSDGNKEDSDPPRRGRGRPRKTPLPLTPKIKKRRGRPPKTSLDGMEGCVLTGGAIVSNAQAQDLSSMTVTAGTSLLLKRRRGRPPKNYFGSRDGRPNENYNATNLPFGDFSYLTDMMYSMQQQAIPFATFANANTSNDGSERTDNDHSMTETSHERTIDVSDSSTDDEDNPSIEPEENVPPIGVETQIMTVGDCQIVKIPNPDENMQEKNETIVKVSSAPGTVTITPISSVGDCTIMPIENDT